MSQKLENTTTLVVFLLANDCVAFFLFDIMLK